MVYAAALIWSPIGFEVGAEGGRPRRPNRRRTGSRSCRLTFVGLGPARVGRNGFRRLRTCADGIPSVQRSSAATAGTAGPASGFEHAVRMPIELAPLLDRAPGGTPATKLAQRNWTPPIQYESAPLSTSFRLLLLHHHANDPFEGIQAA